MGGMTPRNEAEAPAQGLREAKKERTRQAIVDAGLDIVIESGRTHATVEAIAERAGVSVRTFHNYFDSKDAMFAHPLAQLLDVLTEKLGEQPSGAEYFDALSGAWIGMLEAESGRILRVAAAFNALGSAESVESRVSAVVTERARPLIDELVRRHRKNNPFSGLSSELAATLSLRVLVEATTVALSSTPQSAPLLGPVELAPGDADVLLREVTEALGALRSVFSQTR